MIRETPKVQEWVDLNLLIRGLKSSERYLRPEAGASVSAWVLVLSKNSSSRKSPIPVHRACIGNIVLDDAISAS